MLQSAHIINITRAQPQLHKKDHTMKKLYYLLDERATFKVVLITVWFSLPLFFNNISFKNV